MKNKVPVPCPSSDKVSAAFDVLTQQALHWYQLLYFKGLTTPGGNPIMVERGYWESAGCLHPQTVINIYPSPDLPAIRDMVPSLIHVDAKAHQAKEIAKRMGFTIRYDDTDETVLKKVKMMMGGLGKPVRQWACCSLAKPRNCVCVASFECPLHGDRCVGSHE